MPMRPFIAFDIETAPTPRALALEPTEEFLNKGIRENFKPETQMLHRENNAAAWGDEIAKRGALDWRLGSIAAAGTARRMAHGSKEYLTVTIDLVVGDDGPSGLELTERLGKDVGPDSNLMLQVRALPGERQLLMKTWGALAAPGAELVSGFAVRSFDIPWLLGRSAAQGLIPSRRLSNTRYQHEYVADWADILTWYDAFPRTGWTLADYADWFDLPFKPWGEGSEIPGWLEEKDYASIAKHLAFDLLTSHALHERFAPVYLHSGAKT